MMVSALDAQERLFMKKTFNQFYEIVLDYREIKVRVIAQTVKI